MWGFKITIYDNSSLDAKIVKVVFTASWVRLNNTHTFGHCVIFWAIPKGVSTAMIIFLCPRNHEAFSSGSGNRGRRGKTLGIIDQPFRPIIRACQASGISYLTTVLTCQFFWIRSRSRSNTNDTLVDNQFINTHVYIQKYLPEVYNTKSCKKVKCLAFSTWIYTSSDDKKEYDLHLHLNGSYKAISHVYLTRGL